MDVYRYELPRDRIAPWPAARRGARDSARLLSVKLLPDGGAELEDSHFSDLPKLLVPGDLLVLNDTAVQPRRYFSKRSTDGREFELLLCRELEDGAWEALARPMNRLTPGDRLDLGGGIAAEVVCRTEDMRRIRVNLCGSSGGRPLVEELDAAGLMPIPPYIRGGRAENEDREFYQTVFAAVPGSIAAPTAGLHFTPALLESLSSAGVETCRITHHVGTASFQDAESEQSFRPDAERYSISAETAERLSAAKSDGRRVISVGTTTCRALESFARDPRRVTDSFVETDLFIVPGHEFVLVDALITNFHQPRSTHMQLVSAFAGAGRIGAAYEHALRGDYRFLSYGDAMLLAQQRR